jgi:hypothetical protein
LPFSQEGPIVYGGQRVDGALLFASIALKIGKNGLKARKLWPPKVVGGCFYKKFSIKQLIAYFQTSQKILKYYSVAYRVTR